MVIQEVAKIVGIMFSYLPAMACSRLHYRALERDKIAGLPVNGGNCRAKVNLSAEGLADISWWLQNVDRSGWPIGMPGYDVMYCDASLQGYGCNVSGKSFGSRWSNAELLNCMVIVLMRLSCWRCFIVRIFLVWFKV